MEDAVAPPFAAEVEVEVEPLTAEVEALTAEVEALTAEVEALTADVVSPEVIPDVACWSGAVLEPSLLQFGSAPEVNNARTEDSMHDVRMRRRFALTLDGGEVGSVTAG